MDYICRRFSFWLALLFSFGFLTIPSLRAATSVSVTSGFATLRMDVTNYYKSGGQWFISVKLTRTLSDGNNHMTVNTFGRVTGLGNVVGIGAGDGTPRTATATFNLPGSATFMDFSVSLYGGVYNEARLDLLCSMQEITITPGNIPEPLRVGDIIVYDIDGALSGQNLLHEFTTGNGSLVINQSTGTAVFTATQSGAVAFKIWSPAGNGYCKSNEVDFSYTVINPGRCVAFSINNPYDGPVAVKFVSGDPEVEVYRGEANPGVTRVLVTDLLDSDPVTAFYSSDTLPYRWDEETGTWWRTVGGFSEPDLWTLVGTKNPSLGECENDTGAPTVSVKAPVINPSDPENPKDPPTTAPTGPHDVRTGNATTGSVWNSVNNSNVDNSVTNNTFTEGVGKLEKQIEETNSRLDQIEGGINETNDKLTDLGGKLDGIKDAIESGGGMSTEEGAALSAGQGATDGEGNGIGSAAAQSTAEDLIPRTGQPGSPSISKSAPSFLVSFPAAMGGGTYDLNPFRADRFGGIIDWFRTATAWSVVVSFALWASFRVKEWVVAVSAVNQAKGNPIIGGTGAQATALIAAGAITVAVSVFLVALVAFLAGDFALSNLLGVIGVNPTTGLLGTSAWMLDRCFPVGIMISAVGARVAWNFYASSIFSVCTAAIRFIVP